MKHKAKRGHRKSYLFKIVVLLAAIGTIFLFAAQQFRVPSERIVYIQSADDGSSNLWMVSLNNPDRPRQLTFNGANHRIWDYQISSDGEYIVYYNMDNEARQDELILINTKTRSQEILVSCSPESSCYDFELSPTGDFVVYYFTEFPSVEEIRLIDLTRKPFQERVLYQHEGELQWYIPKLSIISNSNLVTFNTPEEYTEAQVFDIEQNTFLQPLQFATLTSRPLFSGDGSLYAYYSSDPDILFEVRETNAPNEVLSYYRERTSEVWFGGKIHDWHPDNEHLLISVEYSEYCENTTYSSTYESWQFYILDTTTGEIEPLPAFGDSLTRGTWNSDGSQIVYSQRLDPCDYFSESELVIYDMETASNTVLPIIGFYPQWLGE